MSIGLGIVTYQRPDYLRQCLLSLIKNNFGGANKIIIVDDGSDSKHDKDYQLIIEAAKEHNVVFVKNPINKGVAATKNIAIGYLHKEGCEHILLMEDDILMKHPTTCLNYIAYAKEKNIQHLNFALHGEMNKGKKSDYKGICVYPECIGAFSYYSREVIDKVGGMDEKFINAWEHVEHTKRIIDAGFHTPFWKFADHPFSELYLEEITGSIDNSSIRPRLDWSKNIREGMAYWIRKHGDWLPARE